MSLSSVVVGNVSSSFHVHNTSNQNQEEKTQIKCHLCPKTFSKISNLKAHINGVHERVTTRACDLCTYSTNWKSDLTKHYRKYHPSNNFVKMPADEQISTNSAKLHMKDEFSNHGKSEKSYDEENSDISPNLNDPHLKNRGKIIAEKHITVSVLTPNNEENITKPNMISEPNSESDPLDVTKKIHLKSEIKTEVKTQSSNIMPTTQVAQSAEITQATQFAQSSVVAQLPNVPIPISEIIQSVVDQSAETLATQLAQSPTPNNLRNLIESQVVQSDKITQATQFTQPAQSSTKSTPSTLEMITNDPMSGGEVSKPHKKCNFCDKTFKQKSNLKAHINGVHTNVITFCCDQCDYITSYKSDLKKHLAKKHDTILEKSSNVEKIVKLPEPPKLILSDGEIAKLAKMTHLSKSTPEITLSQSEKI